VKTLWQWVVARSTPQPGDCENLVKLHRRYGSFYVFRHRLMVDALDSISRSWLGCPVFLFALPGFLLGFIGPWDYCVEVWEAFAYRWLGWRD